MSCVSLPASPWTGAAASAWSWIRRGEGARVADGRAGQVRQIDDRALGRYHVVEALRVDQELLDHPRHAVERAGHALGVGRAPSWEALIRSMPVEIVLSGLRRSWPSAPRNSAWARALLVLHLARPDQRPQRRHQLDQLDGVDQVAVRPELEATGAVLGSRHRRRQSSTLIAAVQDVSGIRLQRSQPDMSGSRMSRIATW